MLIVKGLNIFDTWEQLFFGQRANCGKRAKVFHVSYFVVRHSKLLKKLGANIRMSQDWILILHILSNGLQ
jgi:hypothetical protein